MGENSRLLPVEDIAREDNGFYNPVLLKESEVSRLYRVSKAGKHFIIKTAKDDSGRLASLVRREYEISIDLDHPYIIKVYVYEEDTGVGPGLVMEYVDGRTLGEFLQEDPPMSLRKRVMGQILDAVGYLHRKGIIHNDLKPDNILITRSDNCVRIIDFGLSDSDAYFLAKTLGCTPQYASPELLGRETLDSRSDIYSLGMILKEVLGGRYSHIWRKCLQTRKEKRFGNVDQIRRALDRRIYPFFIVAAVAVVVIFFYSRMSELDKMYQKDIAQTTFIDSLKNVTEEKLDSIFCKLTRVLQDIPYSDFGYMEMGKAMEDVYEIWTNFPKSAGNEELMNHYQYAYNMMVDKILVIIAEKPPLTPDGLSEQEFQYYSSLLLNNQPYQPYSP